MQTKTYDPQLACERLVSRTLVELQYVLMVYCGVGNFEIFRFMDDQFNLRFVYNSKEYFIGFKCTALDTDGNRLSSDELVKDITKLDKITMRALIMFPDGTKNVQESFDKENIKTLLDFCEYLNHTDISLRLVNSVYNALLASKG